MRRLLRFLKMAANLDENNDTLGLQRLSAQFDAFINKHYNQVIVEAHYAPQNDGSTPNPWRRNMDYAGWDNSPYFGSVSEFMEKFPGGIRDWIEWRRETQTDRNKKWSDFSWQKKAEHRIRTAGKKRKAIYSAIFLTPQSKDALADWWIQSKGELLPKQFMHHMTLKFKPSPEEVLSLPLGKDVKLQIIGIGSDEKGQAVAVSSEPQSNNPIPHITVATDGTSPVYSNELLSAGIIPIDLEFPPPVLTGTVGFFDGKEKRVDLVGTIYEEMDKQPEDSKSEPTLDSESEADTEYFGEENVEENIEEDREKAFDLIAKHIEMYQKEFGITDEEIKQWLESKYGKMSVACFIDVKEDKTKDFPDEPHLWSGDGPGSFKSVFEFIKKYRSQDAKDSDASGKAVIDFIKYWKLLKSLKGNKKAGINKGEE